MEPLAWVVGIGGAFYLLFRFPRPSLIFIGAVVVVGVAVGGFFYAQDYMVSRKAEKVSGKISYDLEKCSDDHPLWIGVLNESNDTVEKFSFTIEGHLEGYSDPLYSSGYSSDRIIPSGKAVTACWTLPRQAYGASEQRVSLNPPDTLVWTVKSIRPTFRAP